MGHTIYFHLIESDIMLRQLNEMKKHLEELTALASNQEDIQENVGWVFKNWLVCCLMHLK